MPYNQLLADRIREQFSDLPGVEEKEMMGGLSFMLNGKMCVGVIKDEMVCRIDPALYDAALEKNGCRAMDFTGRPMKGWIMIDENGMKTKKDFAYWVGLAIAFNKKAKSSKKKK